MEKFSDVVNHDIKNDVKGIMLQNSEKIKNLDALLKSRLRISLQEILNFIAYILETTNVSLLSYIEGLTTEDIKYILNSTQIPTKIRNVVEIIKSSYNIDITDVVNDILRLDNTVVALNSSGNVVKAKNLMASLLKETSDVDDIVCMIKIMKSNVENPDTIKNEYTNAETNFANVDVKKPDVPGFFDIVLHFFNISKVNDDLPEAVSEQIFLKDRNVSVRDKIKWLNTSFNFNDGSLKPIVLNVIADFIDLKETSVLELQNIPSPLVLESLKMTNNVLNTLRVFYELRAIFSSGFQISPHDFVEMYMKKDVLHSRDTGFKIPLDVYIDIIDEIMNNNVQLTNDEVRRVLKSHYVTDNSGYKKFKINYTIDKMSENMIVRNIISFIEAFKNNVKEYKKNVSRRQLS